MPTSRFFISPGIATLLARLISLGTSAASVILVPSFLPVDEVGIFFVTQTYVSIIAILIQFGLNYSAISSLAGTSATAEPAEFGRRLTDIVRLQVVVAATVVAFWLVSWCIGAAGGLGSSLSFYTWILMAVSFVPTGLAAVLIEVVRARHRAMSAAMISTIPGLGFVLGMGALAAIHARASVEAVVAIAALSQILTLIVARILAYASLERTAASPRPVSAIMSLAASSFPNLITSLLLFAVSQADLLILSILGDFVDVTHYGIAIRISTIFVLPLSIANTSYSPEFVRQWKERRLIKLQRLVRSIVITCTGISALAYLLTVFIGMLLFGSIPSSYQASFALIVVLGIGQVLHTSAGTSGVLLMLLGQQKYVLLAVALWGVAYFVLATSACIMYGAIGLATVSAFFNAAQVWLFAFRARRRFGLSTSIVSTAKPVARE